MIRKIMLALVSLAILIACYFLYNMFFGLPVAQPPVEEKADTSLMEKATSQPMKSVGTLAEPKAAVMSGEGDEAFFERWERGRLLYQFRSIHWKPTDPNKTGMYDLEKPELRLFLRGGQILHVSADQGQIEGAQKSSKYEPKRGELKGNIHIYLDRGTDPKRSAAEMRPGDIIHIFLNEVRFDLENNRLDTDDPINIEADEAKLVGEGLTITWNNVTNQIEEITIRKGEKMVLYRGADMLGIKVPGVDKNGKEPAATGEQAKLNELAKTAEGRKIGSQFMATPLAVKKSRFKIPEAEAQEQTASSAPASQATSKPSKKPRAARSYRLTFTSDVKIRQMEGDELTGSLICDRLSVVFDLPKGSEGDTLTSQPAKDKKSPRGNKRLEITWQGPMEIRPEEMSSTSPLRRFHILASGQDIHIEQKEQGAVRCKKLTYFEETKQVWLDGTIEEPVNVSQGESRTIVAAHLFFDRKKGIASGEGPGFMQERASDKTKSKTTAENDMLALGSLQSGGQKMKVLWNEGFKLTFGELENEVAEETKSYIQYAEFRGKARMEGSGVMMNGNLLVLNFLKPEAGEKVEGKIDTLHAKGDVLLKSDEQEITCENLDVTFADGRTPKVAYAKGQVRATEKRRLIVADELRAEMAAEKSEIVASKVPGQAGVKTTRTKIVIREVEAKGNVAIRDPHQKLRVDCRTLQASFDAQRTIQWCTLEGTAKNWASADLPNDYYIAGEKIYLKLANEEISVPGPGKMRFANDQDIEGTKGNKVYINIRWSTSMKMTGGEKNQGTFLGQATIRSDFTTLYCDKMVVNFENAPAEEKKAEPVKKKGAWDLSRFTSLIKSQKSEEEIKLPVTRKRPTYIQAWPEEGKTITIQYAKREKKTLLNRSTLWGSELTIDLVGNKINIPSEGTFLIEDMQKGKKAAVGETSAVGKVAPQAPFGNDMKSDSPSVTKFMWKNGLTYLLDSKTAIFDGSVNMLHVAGGNIFNQASYTFDLKNRKPDRETTLTCDNLKVEFLKGAFGLTGANPSARSMDLGSVVATGSVHLQDSPRSVIAPQLTYNRKEKIVVVRGSEGNPAYLYEEKGQTGQYMMWEGPLIIWDQATDEIQAPGASITTTLQ